MKLSRLRTLWALPVCLLLAPLAHAGAAPAAPAAPAPVTTSPQSVSLNVGSYVMRPTDIVQIKVMEDPAANVELGVSVDGTVQLQYFTEPFKIAGLTENEARAAITQKYIDAKIFIKPQVTVSVLKHAEQRVYVIGQVNRPGPVLIPPQEVMTLVSAVTSAGGPTRIAAAFVTITRRLPDGSTITINHNLKQAMDNADRDMKLQDGDSIWVKEHSIGGVF